MCMATAMCQQTCTSRAPPLPHHPRRMAQLQLLAGALLLVRRLGSRATEAATGATCTTLWMALWCQACCVCGMRRRRVRSVIALILRLGLSLAKGEHESLVCWCYS